jgi:hypothetical protein
LHRNGRIDVRKTNLSLNIAGQYILSINAAY